MIKNKELKEHFCLPCLLPLAAAAGAGGAAASTSEKDKKKRKIILWVSIIISVLSIILFIYFKTRCNNCK